MMTELRYPNALVEDGRNLSRLALDKKIGLPAHREQPVAAVLDAIRRGRSVLVIGSVGVGKTFILHGVAAELPRVARELWELPSNAVLTGTRYLGDWQSKAESILHTLKSKRGVLYFTDIWNLLTVGTSSNDPACLFDYLRPKMQTGELQLIGELTPERFQTLQTAPLFTSLFDVVYVTPLDDAEISGIALEYAVTRQIHIDAREINELLTLCARFMPSDCGPGRVLRLVQQVADYQTEKMAINEPEQIDQSFVEKVFSIYSGLPRFVVSRTVNKPAQEIRQWFGEQIIGQQRAIDAVVEVITLFKAGLHDPTRPIGTMLFVGPTGVGKTELAKSLARYLFGSDSRLLRFDLSEFKDYHAFQMLVGNPDRPLQPARLLDPVRAQPFQVILLDEIEKAHPNVWDMLLQLLDEGHVSPPNGMRANFRNTIVIATSNVGSQDVLKQSMGFVSAAHGTTPIKSLETVFRPELLNRFQHIVTFDGLTRDNVRQIARKEIRQLMAREGIISRNLAVEVGDDVLNAVVETGYDREYGARALRRQVQQRVLLPIASRLMETEIYPGSILKLDIAPRQPDDTGPGITRVRVLDSDVSREKKREAARERIVNSQRPGAAELRSASSALGARLSRLLTYCNKDELLRRLKTLDEQRAAPHFWSDVATANATLVAIDELHTVITRLDSLSAHLAELHVELDQAPSPRQLESIERSFNRANEQILVAERELMRMGPHGSSDVLFSITPIATATNLRNLLFQTYSGWSKWRGYQLQILTDPLDENNTTFFAVKGLHAFGYLRREHGVHRLRNGHDHEAVRVRVAPWSHTMSAATFGVQRALKQSGKSGDKVRSQVEVVADVGFTLQNNLTIAENRELATEIVSSWQSCLSSDVVVRRYDLDPFLLKDHLTGLTSGKPSTLHHPQEFHELLCSRVDVGDDHEPFYLVQ